MVAPGVVDAVLGAHHFPELSPDLVAALATLNVKDLTHLRLWGRRDSEGEEREKWRIGREKMRSVYRVEECCLGGERRAASEDLTFINLTAACYSSSNHIDD
nr:hypothetical protein Ccrd_018050 [Ipomoea trifida]